MNMKLVFLAAVLAVLTVSPPTSAARPKQLEELGRLLTHISNVLGKYRPKRVCTGYMCSYSHASNAAGKTAVHKTLMSYIYRCAADPKCSPGKRRKRSLPLTPDTRSLLEMTRYQHQAPSLLTS